MASKVQKPAFSYSTHSPVDQILHLQRTIGNRAVQRLIKSGTLQAKLKIGQPLPRTSRDFFESRFGHDFSKVRIHADSGANNLARSVNAHVYTRGRDVVFSAGEYMPCSNRGRRLLSHELVHVLQRQLLYPHLLIQRSCKEHPSEDYYKKSKHYCLDTSFSPITHKGERCYREIPKRKSYFDCPPGEHVCFDEKGNCKDSPDKATLAKGKESDGSCYWNWWCTLVHVKEDYLPAKYKQYKEKVKWWGASKLQKLERELFKRMFPMPF